MKSDKLKLIVAIAIFVVAGVLIAWRLNFFGGGGEAANLPKAPTGDPNARFGGPHAAPPTK